MDGHDRLLTAFLAGELDPADAPMWDQHLLACERCWRAVLEDRAGRHAARLLRRPAPPWLADRIAFTVEMAGAAPPAASRRSRAPALAARRGRHGRRPRWTLAAVCSLAVGSVAAAVALTMVLLLSGRQTGGVPAAVAAVARYARAIPPPALGEHPRGKAPPVEVGRPVTVSAGGQRMVLRTWRVGRTEAVVAVSRRPFARPAASRGVSGMGMAWSARLGRLGLYCLNGRTSELVAAPVPAEELAALAARLPLA